ncbi:MAG: Verru_Chthon cassette protein B [Chthoniobacteraceae bacterium]
MNNTDNHGKTAVALPSAAIDHPFLVPPPMTSYKAPQGVAVRCRSIGTLPSRRNAAAFTLVEVVMAIGIIAFAFIPLVGLLPVGLDMSRRAIDTTVQSQIVQQLSTEAQQSDFSTLSTLASNSTTTPYYFDDQGSKATNSANQIYEAVYSVALNSGTVSTALPGQVTTQKLATVTICVLNQKSGRTNFTQADLTKNPDSRKFTLLIPDNGR